MKYCSEVIRTPLVAIHVKKILRLLIGEGKPPATLIEGMADLREQTFTII